MERMLCYSLYDADRDALPNKELVTGGDVMEDLGVFVTITGAIRS